MALLGRKTAQKGKVSILTRQRQQSDHTITKPLLSVRPAELPGLGATVRIHSAESRGSEIHRLECSGKIVVVVSGQPV